MWDLNTTVVLLRVTAFCSVLCFTAAYAFSLRKYWLLFVLSHSIHLGFIFWYTVGLHHPVSSFTLWSGVVAYSVIFVMAGFDVYKPGSALENLWGLWFIGLNLFGTFPVMIYGHWGKETRIHSWLGMALMVAGLVLRQKRGIASKTIDRKTMMVRSLFFLLLCMISFCLVAFLRSRSPSILGETTEIEADYDTIGSLVLSPSVLAQSFPDVREIEADQYWPRAGST